MKMKFSIDKDALLGVLALATKVASANAASPALGCVLVALNKGGALMVSATDTSVSLDFGLQATKADGKGDMLLDATLLYKSVKEMPKGEISFETSDDGNSVTIDWGSGHSTMPCLDTDAFPDPVKMADAKTIKADAAALADAIAQTVPFTATEENANDTLKCVSLEATEDALTLVASDAHTLSIAHLAAKSTGAVKNTVPKKSLEILLPLLDKVPEGTHLALAANDRNLRVTYANWQLTARLLDRKYPSWPSIVPKAKDVRCSATASREELLQSLRRVGVIRSKECKALVMTIGEDGTTLKTDDRGNASVHEKLDATLTGDPVTIAFNIDMLEGAVKTMPAEKVSIRIVSPTRAVLLMDADDEKPFGENSAQILVMPMVAA